MQSSINWFCLKDIYICVLIYFPLLLCFKMGSCDVVLSSQSLTCSRQQSERSQFGESGRDSDERPTAAQNWGTEEQTFAI